MADKIYPAILPNTIAYDMGNGLYSPVNPHIGEQLNHMERYYGKLNPQTATLWCDGATLNPFVAISGNNTWGVEEKLFGADDVWVELGAGFLAVGFNMFLPVANTSDTTSRLRIIWGTGTMAAAIALNQYTELMYHKLAANAVYSPRPIACPVIPFSIAGLQIKVWAQHWNLTNLATISFFLGAHSFQNS